MSHLCAVQCVLVGHVPVVPHEPLLQGVAGVLEPEGSGQQQYRQTRTEWCAAAN